MAADAPTDYEGDVRLQKASAELIEEFDRRLIPLLRKPDSTGRMVVRTQVASRDTYYLTMQVLEPFQELPQLLDPHLASWVSTLATAYLEFNVMRAVDRRQQQLLEAERGGGDRAAPEKDKAVSNKWSVPLSTAITDILYTLCKIRGEKVIVRFLHAEVRYIEPLIAAFEAAEPRPQQGPVERWRPTPMGTMWKYEERYIVLLWLSHLMLAPFDLATISSDRVSVSDEDVEDESDEDNKGATSSNRDRQHDAAIPGFEWPAGLPSIATRLLPLATKYLVVPSKERDGARALLVRLAMRRDMQALGLLDALVRWGLGIVRPPRTLAAGEASGVVHSIYAYVGVLSLLAGMLRSSETTLDMVPYLRPIFSAVTGVVVDAAAVDNRQQAKGRDAVSELIVGSATARKLLVKTARCCAVAALHYVRNQGVLSSMGAEGERKRAALSADQAIDIVEEAVGYLMERLPDTDTPVRFAASKALSVITLALGAGSTGDGADGFNSETMAHDVVEAVLQALKENVRVTTGPPVVADEDGDRLDIVVPYIGDYSQSMSEEGEAKATAARPRVYDLSSVSPLAWHGLVLTLSHLLYRRSPPRSMLKDVVEALRLALQFEQRSATGGSVGANVRDAACFGAWAVARRYTTEELLAAEGEDFNGGSGRGSGKTAVSVTREEDEPSAAGEGGTGGGGSKGSERSHEKEEEWETEEEMSEKQSKAKRKKAGKKPQSLKLDASATAPVRPKLGPRTSSLLQSLATSLVVTATLDPSGNVRRAASAALQELVGRHPDSIVAGIALVQAVDYHAVALRSRACLEVAARAAAAPYTPTGCLDEYAHRVEMRSVFVDSGSAADATVCLLDYPARAYAVPILEAVLDSWRGVGGSAGESTEAAAAAARRMLARAYGKISEAVFLAEMARVVPILDPFHDTKYRRRPDWVPDSPDEEKKVAADREDEDSLPPLVPIVAGPGDDSSQDGGVGPSRTRALAPWKLDRVPKHGTVLIEKRLSKLSLAIVTRLLDSYKGDAVTKDGKGRPGERNARGGSEKRRIERRHGLILCGAALLDAVPSIIHRLHAESMLPPVLWSALCRIFWQKGEGDGDQSDNMLRIVFRGDVYASLPPLPSDDGGDGGDGQPTQSPPPSTTQPPRMPKLLVEAFCRLLVAHLPILMMEGVLDEETEAAEMASGSAGRPPKPAFAALPLVTPPFDLVAPGSDLVSPPRIHAVANAAIAGRIPFARKGQGGVLSDLLVRAIMSQAMTANLASTWTTGTTSGDGVDDFGDDGDNQLADAASAAAVTIAALLDRRRFACFVFELCCGAFQEPVRLRYPDGVASPWGHATDLHWLRGDRVGGGGGGGSGASGSGAGAGAGGGVGSLPITPLLRALTRIFPLTTSTMFVDLSTTVGAALLHWWSLTTPKVIAGLALPAPPLGFLQKGRATAAPVAAGTSNAQESDATVLSSLPSGPTDIEARVALLRALTTKTDILTLTPQRWTDMLADALDDYTTNARGDVGSYVRVEAVRCVRVIWEALLRQDALGRAAREDYGDGADASGEGGAEEGDRIGISIAELALKPDVAILLRKIWRLAAEKLDRVRNDARETLFVLMRHAKHPVPDSQLALYRADVTLYFASLLEYAYWAGGWRLAPASSTGPPLLLPASRDLPLVDRSSLYLDALLAGLVSSADTGSEDLIVAARRALAYFCTGDVLMLSAGGSGPDYAERPWSLLWRRPSSSPSTSKQMGETTPTAGKQLPAGDDAGARINHIRAATLARSLLVNLSGRDDGVVQGLAGATDPSAAAEKDPPRSRPDRIVIPTLEVLAYLLRAGLLPLDDGTNASPAVAATAVNPSDQAPLPLVNLKKLCLAVQRAGYKTGSLRKLEACVHVYGAVAFLSRATAADAGVENENLVAGGREARRRLAALLSHPWPHVRSLVVDELWVAMEGEMLQDEDGKYGQCGGTGERCEKRSLLLGVDWGTAKRDVIKDLVRRLGLE